LIVIITFSDLPAGNNVNILETGGNSDKQKNIKEPRLGAEPTIEKKAEPDSDGYRQYNGNAHAGNHRKTSEKLTITIGHG
jgi:hypothetical protein